MGRTTLRDASTQVEGTPYDLARERLASAAPEAVEAPSDGGPEPYTEAELEAMRQRARAMLADVARKMKAAGL